MHEVEHLHARQKHHVYCNVMKRLSETSSLLDQNYWLLHGLVMPAVSKLEAKTLSKSFPAF